MSSNTTDTEKEYKELDLSKAGDLDMFIESVEESYIDTIELNSIAQKDCFKKMKISQEEGQEVFKNIDRKFAEVQDLVIDCHDKIISDETEPPDEVIIKMQDLYNDIVNIRDDVFDAYSIEEQEEEAVTEISESELFKDGTFLPEKNKRKKMSIKPDDLEVSVPITVARKAEKTIKHEVSRSDSSVNNVVNKETLQSKVKPVIAEMESKDPINEVVVSNGERIPVMEKLSPKGSLTDLYLQEGKYLRFLKSIDVSQADFERKLTSQIRKIESMGTDNLERWIGVKQKSPFVLLKPMSLAEIESFISGPDARDEVISEGLKYETFLIWIDLMYGMIEVVRPSQSMKFGELYAKWVIESAMESMED